MSDQQVVHLKPEDVDELAAIISGAALLEQSMRLWVDDGGLKFSIERQTWSLPLGQTWEPGTRVAEPHLLPPSVTS